MTLLERMRGELTAAQKTGQSELVNLLRFCLAQVHNREIEKRGKGGESTLTDLEVIDVLRREEKRRKEAVELMRKGGRLDLVKEEERQLSLLGQYLPLPLGREEIVTVLDALKARGVSDKNMLMREAMKQLKGKVGGDVVMAIIEEVAG